MMRSSDWKGRVREQTKRWSGQRSWASQYSITFLIWWSGASVYGVSALSAGVTRRTIQIIYVTQIMEMIMKVDLLILLISAPFFIIGFVLVWWKLGMLAAIGITLMCIAASVRRVK